MESKDAPTPDDDPVVDLVMALGLPGFCIGLLLATAAIFYICRRAIEFFFPGA
ncbi:hypothetical protein [Achromobacter marplatensis]|uniref:Uncharacterized protein n=2 Tax=Achromobacter marplatensis TaxID=470868 RepID=A0ABX9FWD5_9BURK|nr:hypothetical protein [Achromobacter marplatensis]RBP11305.1 hypothetical protein DFP87_12366 [Achromobacter marplatensis]CAB3711674.1 hypothetical protein LMG26219_05958 [Achromobacter marplatensis]